MELRDEILNNGYVIVRGVFTEEEVNSFKKASDIYDYGDLLSYPNLAPFILNSILLSSLRKIIGSKPVYFGDSGALIGPRPRGLHRDLKHQDALSMHGLVLRVGLYISPQGKKSGGLKIVPRTQHKKNSYLRNFFFSRNIVMEIGDLLIWDLRLFHSGSALMPFGLNFSLHPTIEDFIDKSGPKKKIDRLVLLATFSDNSELMELYCRERCSEHMREHWLKSFNWSEDVVKLIEASDMEIVRRN